ncbi:hypothetical protein ADIMK_2977 [Marinobacterium lacunae]|uniref:Uncharacterized protein n=1 Tax=Marinobacterium lacunae TaxID=1232683 RepID=A0A081FWG3_9GAMM|nr:hypothetical protein ADIMK_2977 [Marinobacterium lacunae]
MATPAASAVSTGPDAGRVDLVSAIATAVPMAEFFYKALKCREFLITGVVSGKCEEFDYQTVAGRYSNAFAEAGCLSQGQMADRL